MNNSDYLKRQDAVGHLKVMELLRKWDPIGVISEANQDEYDMYSYNIVRMLDSGITAIELAEHLSKIQLERMGLKPKGARDLSIAEELVDFWKNGNPLNSTFSS
ncbi:MAG: hypothetical protein IPN65_07305 [Elusimicrobia bacterium]|nr:hypothetical protein [Elusimicrobiota bacterium]MBK7208733.1 hypothetical protein [Elusimicrobiota bacterium]MBK7544424.1 hypothetical protein [Elusimicrobiota bacterium]MBK7573946.1 hypothetical protein [Elusimicrobiota bacterium]MBK7689544.1 hypothetical protein [Elusimicrobiota bacterium]